MNEKELGRAPVHHYGSLEQTIRDLRASRPLDLSFARWGKAHPAGAFEDWRRDARRCLRDALQYDPGAPDLHPETTERVETTAFVRERIAFNTAPWFRVPGYFYTPKHVPLPAPAVVVMHEWGGPMLFGCERVCGETDHPALVEHRKIYAGGRALADFFASNGYCVIAIDAYHFGRRVPRGVSRPLVPDEPEPWNLPLHGFYEYERSLSEVLYLGVRELNWAGTTWCGVNFGDDSRCIDYLEGRPEVDASRVGVTGLSGGGWRTNILAALDERVKAAVPVGWMTTGDTQQAYNLVSAIGTFCLLPGVWNRLDVPDLIAMAAPAACMVVSGRRDPLFPPAGQQEAARQIGEAYRRAGCPERFRDYSPDKSHCYDIEIQEEALKWFDHHLKGASAKRGSR